MKNGWFKRVRQIHTWLGVFFSPLLLLFIATGWWQTFATDDDMKAKTGFNGVMAKFSNIHTDDYFAHGGAPPQASKLFQIYVGCMAAMLIVTILLGLVLACQSPRKIRWLALAFFLGVLIPALMLYFN